MSWFHQNLLWIAVPATITHPMIGSGDDKVIFEIQTEGNLVP